MCILRPCSLKCKADDQGPEICPGDLIQLDQELQSEKYWPRSLPTIPPEHHLYLGICFVSSAIAAVNASAVLAAKELLTLPPGALPRKGSDTMCQLLLQVPVLNHPIESMFLHSLLIQLSSHWYYSQKSQMMSAISHKLMVTPFLRLMDINKLATWFFFSHLWQEKNT